MLYFIRPGGKQLPIILCPNGGYVSEGQWPDALIDSWHLLVRAFARERIPDSPRDFSEAEKFFIYRLHNYRPAMGFLSARRHKGRTLVHWLATDSDLRGEHIGSFLVSELVRAYPGQDVGAKTASQDPIVRYFYEKLDFKEVSQSEFESWLAESV